MSNEKLCLQVETHPSLLCSLLCELDDTYVVNDTLRHAGNFLDGGADMSHTRCTYQSSRLCYIVRRKNTYE